MLIFVMRSDKSQIQAPYQDRGEHDLLRVKGGNHASHAP